MFCLNFLALKHHICIMSQDYKILEKTLANVIKLVIISEILNIALDYDNVEELGRTCSTLTSNLAKKILVKRIGVEKSKKVNESIERYYKLLYQSSDKLEAYFHFIETISEIAFIQDEKVIWKRLEDLENYLIKTSKEESSEEFGATIYTISDFKRLLISYLSKIDKDNVQSVIIRKNERYYLILGDKIYELQINGLSDDEKSSKDNLRLQTALELLLKEEEKIINSGYLGEIFTVGKIMKRGNITNVMISFANAKPILPLKPEIKVRLLNKSDDICIFISEDDKENLYALSPCQYELEKDNLYVYKGENAFEKINQP